MENIAYLESLNYNYNIDIKKIGNAILAIDINNDKINILKQPFNCGRATDLINFLNIVLKNKKHNLDGIYVFGLDDACHHQTGIMVFSKTINEKNVLIPDTYASWNYGGKLYIKDIEINKKNEMLFIGSSTGNHDPTYNNRLKICNDALKYSNKIKCYINNICQISKQNIQNIYPLYNNFIHSSMHIEEQLKYKYIISIDGNTAAWDRVPWILNSKSILVKHKSDEICWYYYLLEKDTHYLEFKTIDDLNNILNENKNYDHIIKKANEFVEYYLTYETHLKYMELVLLNIKLNKPIDK